jgi:hypothetical protein
MSKLGKQAEAIQRLMNEGKLSEDDLPALIGEGLDSKIVDYWREHYKMTWKEDKMDTTQNLIDKLTSAISYKFKDDGTRPNLTISRLRKGYYCSVVRFPKGAKDTKNKIVVCKAEADSLDAALKGVTMAFLVFADHQPDPIQELVVLAETPKKI